MDTKEYFKNLSSNDEHLTLHPEFLTYTTVWMKSRMPEAYNELKARFKSIEGEIYAQEQCDSAKTDF
jgi:hypothetical protein